MVAHSKRYILEVASKNEKNVLITRFLEYQITGIDTLEFAELRTEGTLAEIEGVSSFAIVSKDRLEPGPEKYPAFGAFNVLVYFGISGNIQLSIDFISNSFSSGPQAFRYPIALDPNSVPETLRGKTPDEFFCFDLA